MEEGRKLTVPPIDEAILIVRLEGLSPLLCNRWEDPQGTLDKSQARAAGKQNAGDWKVKLYPMNGNTNEGPWGFPAQAFKSAVVDAWPFVKGLKKGQIKGSVFVLGDLVEIEGTPELDGRVARNRNAPGEPAIWVERPKFPTWSCMLRVAFDPKVISASQLVYLVQQAGLKIGVGPMRPGKTGMAMGRWQVTHATISGG